ncbi:DUF4870 domain-containing protein [Rubinisphaera margarita]|uniref:DUF4870 domain-containing protein n=1 Tax=Rubinisphaera margarita TaxID=2909586 RepID=UPI001EE81585|nr:DUF4870 domain-containing protein [Rubinisphaera margarita]MCG6154524.1 DUF4870 domain-containing protein [Rubinisphaera margarita]
MSTTHPETNENRIWAMLCHAVTLLRFLPFVWTVVVPLAIWLAKKETSPFVDRHGRESLNFQLSVLIYHAIATVVFWIFGLVWLAVMIIEVVAIVLILVASIRASEGREFRYPFSLRLIRKTSISL